jgi:hypothetical protein
MAFSRKLSMIVTVTILVIAMATLFWGATQKLLSYGLNSTLTGGRISQNTTWTLANSPYVIISDVIVDDGTALTIDPGVAIRFEGNYSILVNGTLLAVGEGNKPITFTSNKPQPNAGDWNTIKFTGGANESFTIKNSIVEFAREGITIQSSEKAIIENSKIVNNLASGIHVIGKSNLLVKGNIIKYNGNGVLSSGERVSGLKIVDNSIVSNENGIYLQAWAPQGGVIFNITVSHNTVNSNKNGIYFYIWAGFSYPDTSIIRDVSISQNVVSSNENGIYFYSGGPWFGFIYRVTIANNKILSNGLGVYFYANTHYQYIKQDVLLSNNTVTANNKGIFVAGGFPREMEQGIKTNITQNSISYNGFGVFFEGDTDNVAYFNDVYSNTYGMNVTNGATVNAELNYWGDPQGPFHSLLNLLGRGNPVNGNGTDLDFRPFLTSPAVNKRPIARLETDKTLVAVAEKVTFNASKSSDDGRIKEYLFDFGDGSNSSWVTETVATHVYTSIGSFEASLSVMDDLGYENDNTATLTVTVQTTLSVSIIFDTENVISGGNLVIHIHVTNGFNPVPQASITLYSSNGGVLYPQTGITDSAGDFTSNFVAPSVIEQSFILITVNATKEGYWDGQSQKQVAISPKTAIQWFELIWIIAPVATLIVLIIVWAAKKKRSKQNSETIKTPI